MGGPGPPAPCSYAPGLDRRSDRVRYSNIPA